MPPSRRQPRSSTPPPARKPRVAGLRRPTTDEPVSGQLPAEPAAEPRPEPRKPRPRPAPVPRPSAFVPSKGVIEAPEPESASAEETAVIEAVADERPSPRRKVRDTGEAKPEVLEEESVEEETEPRRRSPYVVAGALVAVALLLGGLAFWFKYEEVQVSSATSNTALLDVAKTAQVKDAVSKATEALFSYDFNNIKKTEDAANDLLANDDVRAKYNSLMGEVKRLAPAQKMIVTCKVTRAAVIMLNDDLAKVMVFVDQTSTRTDTKKTTAGSAQLHLNAQLQGDKWKITDMDTYNAPKTPAAPPASSAPASPAPSPSK